MNHCVGKFEVIASCSKSKARSSLLHLLHADVHLPVFMPVGTQGSLKGILSSQLDNLGCEIFLGNTYHLGNYPGTKILNDVGGLHKFMNWKKALLTDSGGYQMVSLLELSEVTEEGVKFRSPHDNTQMLLSPEKSVQIQNSIGADIIMQLDDVVHSSVTGPRLEQAMLRSIRWFDRCLAEHKKINSQLLFPIVQGGLSAKLRSYCAKEMIKRNNKVRGFAIGGLSGGEAKEDFWRMVTLSTDILPQDKPRYLMGVGYAVDLVVCVALGCDMFDCVYPTRTARFGTALTREYDLQLKKKKYKNDFTPIDSACSCDTCKYHNRAYLHSIVTREPVACNLLTIHNVAFQLKLMNDIQESIKQDEFPAFVRKFFATKFSDGVYPQWCIDALNSVNICLQC